MIFRHLRGEVLVRVFAHFRSSTRETSAGVTLIVPDDILELYVYLSPKKGDLYDFYMNTRARANQFE